jgi:hypothetical protein
MKWEESIIAAAVFRVAGQIWKGDKRCSTHRKRGAELPLWVDTVEKLRKRIAAKIRRSELVSEIRCATPPQSSYGGRLQVQRQFLCLPISFFDRRVHGLANFDSSPKTEFFNSIGRKRSFVARLPSVGFHPLGKLTIRPGGMRRSRFSLTIRRGLTPVSQLTERPGESGERAGDGNKCCRVRRKRHLQPLVIY